MDKLKPIATVDLLLSASGLIKSGAILFFMMLLEWGRKREAQAQLETKVAKSDLLIEREKNELDKQARGKSSSDIISNYLNGPK